MPLLKTLQKYASWLFNGNAMGESDQLSQNWGAPQHSNLEATGLDIKTGVSQDGIYQCLEQACRSFISSQSFGTHQNLSFRLDEVNIYVPHALASIAFRESKLPAEVVLSTAKHWIARSDTTKCLNLQNLRPLSFSVGTSASTTTQEESFSVLFDTSLGQTADNRLTFEFIGVPEPKPTQHQSNQGKIRSGHRLTLRPLNKPDNYRLIEEFPCTIGRSPNCDVKLVDEPFVSELHAVIVVNELGQLCIEDRSSHGTWLQKQKLSPTRAQPLDTSGTICLLGAPGKAGSLHVDYAVENPVGVPERGRVTPARQSSVAATKSTVAVQGTPIETSPYSRMTPMPDVKLTLASLQLTRQGHEQTLRIEELPYVYEAGAVKLVIAELAGTNSQGYVTELSGVAHRNGSRLPRVFVWGSGEFIDLGSEGCIQLMRNSS